MGDDPVVAPGIRVFDRLPDSRATFAAVPDRSRAF
jgi:hypothetical protein